jgi:hypothetical protein
VSIDETNVVPAKTQKRKGVEQLSSFADFLCAFASLREPVFVSLCSELTAS